MHRLGARGMRWVATRCLAAGLACGLAVPVLAHPVVVVTSDANNGVVEAADASIAELQRLGVAPDDIVRERAATFARPGTARTDTRVYLTLGVEALREVLKANVKEPIVAALVPRSAFDRVQNELGRKSGAAVSALYLDQPLGRQMALLRLALPEAKRIGVVLGPESMLQQAATVAAIRSHGLEPVVGLALTPDNLFAGLKPALEDADALFALPDSMVYNNSTVPSILMATYRARIPLIAFSPAYVKAGALLCVYSTPQHIGSQAAAMVHGLMRNGAGVPSQYPQDFTVRVNDSVARSLGLSLREDHLADQLRRQERKP